MDSAGLFLSLVIGMKARWPQAYCAPLQIERSGFEAIVLCSWARHLRSRCLSPPRCINGTGEFDAGGWASHPGRSRNTPSRFMLLKPEISAGLMGHLACMQTVLYFNFAKLHLHFFFFCLLISLLFLTAQNYPQYLKRIYNYLSIIFPNKPESGKAFPFESTYLLMYGFFSLH